ncbi:hypothetical protein SAMN05660461_3516 [Chitinophaga ginsengisegetis]|uniref:Uncharacterized protein n=1 Tax=Chitinophaga ginsengisegetis TaxID=393003 RepID=A0A1T5P1Q2_9BACT|nr:hypothetical protein [Chitinophaga ginsengisegetis]MDR6566752.1 hypothetical protein [Chitinophaga ginsengisegetis]MDR6646482.1 hypothetical protein [Chitinophaga ginsengisegetis]MDR6652832.1 hypothetical protein [Chitinophaga ginsengisegetis]SKD06681.1 hypothetical protein SAMN05660461_3516 [Chitinophaga ginsengisegetis]
MKSESITPNNMKSLLILAFLLFAGFMPGVFAQESVKPENTGGNTGKVRDQLFPTFKKDLADLNQRSTLPPADRAVVSKDTKSRLFTNYQPQRPNAAPKLRASKTKPLPSDSAAVAAPGNQASKAVVPIPSQDGGTSPKKN